MNRSQPSNRPGAAPVFGLISITALLWWLRATRFHPDGLDYAQSVKTGVGLFHPHHLLYSPVAWLLHRGLGLDPITAGQLLQLIAFVVTSVAAWHLARRILGSAERATAGTAMLIALRGVLLYTTWLEVYLPALALSLLAADAIQSEDERLMPAVLYLAGAVLFHQMCVLMAPALLLVRPRSARTWRVVGGAGSLVLGAYLVAAGGDPLGFIFRYAQAGVPAWGAPENLGLWGWKALGFGLWAVIAPLPSWFAGPAAATVLLALAIAAVLAIRWAPRLTGETRFAALWLALHLLFVLWWLPTEVDLYVVALAPLWILAMLGWRARPNWISARRVLAAAALLATVNLIVTVVPNRQGIDPVHVQAQAIATAADSNAVIITVFEVQQYLIYFFDRPDAREWSAEVRAGWLPPADRRVLIPAAPPGWASEPGWPAWKSAVAAGRARPVQVSDRYLLYPPAVVESE